MATYSGSTTLTVTTSAQELFGSTALRGYHTLTIAEQADTKFRGTLLLAESGTDKTNEVGVVSSRGFIYIADTLPSTVMFDENRTYYLEKGSDNIFKIKLITGS